MLRKFKRESFYIVRSELEHVFSMGLAIFCFCLWNPWQLPSLPMVFLLCLPLMLHGPIGFFVVGGLVYYVYRPEVFVPSTAIWLSAGLLYGLVHSQLVHFCSHNLFRPRWLNRVLGEFFSIQFFGTFLGFTVVHLEHHAFADDLELDPHPNMGEGFFKYIVRLHGTMARGFQRIYFRLHSETPQTLLYWRVYQWLRPLRCYSRAIFMILALGPSGFLFFMLPCMLINHWVFGHLNYYSHLRKEDGAVEILNLNQKLLHRVLNVFTLGAYNHADHHRRPTAFYPTKKPELLNP